MTKNDHNDITTTALPREHNNGGLETMKASPRRHDHDDMTTNYHNDITTADLPRQHNHKGLDTMKASPRRHDHDEMTTTASPHQPAQIRHDDMNTTARPGHTEITPRHDYNHDHATNTTRHGYSDATTMLCHQNGRHGCFAWLCSDATTVMPRRWLRGGAATMVLPLS